MKVLVEYTNSVENTWWHAPWNMGGIQIFLSNRFIVSNSSNKKMTGFYFAQKKKKKKKETLIDPTVK